MKFALVLRAIGAIILSATALLAADAASAADLDVVKQDLASGTAPWRVSTSSSN